MCTGRSRTPELLCGTTKGFPPQLTGSPSSVTSFQQCDAILCPSAMIPIPSDANSGCLAAKPFDSSSGVHSWSHLVSACIQPLVPMQSNDWRCPQEKPTRQHSRNNVQGPGTIVPLETSFWWRKQEQSRQKHLFIKCLA